MIDRYLTTIIANNLTAHPLLTDSEPPPPSAHMPNPRKGYVRRPSTFGRTNPETGRPDHSP